MDFSEKLLTLRKANNLTQEQLAEKLEVSRQSVSKWESGQATPELEKIVALSAVFDVSTDYLLCKSNIRNMKELQLLDTNGLDEEDLKELQSQIAYMKWKKENIKPKH